jgi:hypothetical protein
MLTKAGYRPLAIFGLWSTVLLAGVLAAAARKGLYRRQRRTGGDLCQALAGAAGCSRWLPMP